MPDQPPPINEAIAQKKFSCPACPAMALLASILFSILCGCATEDGMSFSNGHGDLGMFIFKKSTEFGGHPLISTTPPIETSWRYSEDHGGVVIRTNPKDCSSIETLLRRSFGEPRIATSNNPDVRRFLVYRLTPKGGGIQMLCDSNYTQVIILKPQIPKQPENTK
jgi:hypothetical protein